MTAERLPTPARPLLAACGALLLLPSLAGAAQDAPEPPSVVRASFGVAERDGRLEGRGADYRAAFEPGRMSFTPALGERAPRALPVGFELLDVRVGDVVLVDAAAHAIPAANGHGSAHAPAPTLEGSTVVYDRGAGLLERYEVRADGVHQTFVLDALPASGGDLVVRGRISTELALAAQGPDGVRFEAPGLGGVRFGGVTGIDAAGRTAPGAIAVDGDLLVLSLPAAFVQEAALPLVLDPLIGAVIDVAAGGNVDVDPDVAYESGTAKHLVVWKRSFGPGDTEIRGQMVLKTGALSGSLITITTGTSANHLPSVAAVRASERFVVAFEERPLVGSTQVVVRAVDADDGQVSSPLTVSPSVDHQNNPRIAGDRTASGERALVVWAEDGDLRARALTVPAAGAPSTAAAAVTVAAQDGNLQCMDPVIARSGGDAGRVAIAWTYAYPWSSVEGDPPPASVSARAMSLEGQVLGPIVPVSATPALWNANPAIDGDGQRFVVAWDREEGFGDYVDVMVRTLRWTGSGLAYETPEVVLDGVPGISARSPAVAWTGASALVAYHFAGKFPALLAKSVDPFTCAPCEEPMMVAWGPSLSYSPAVSGEWAGGDAFGIPDNALFVWTTSGADPDVLAARYDAPGEAEDLGGGCAGGTIHAPCAFEANPAFAVQLRNAPPSSFAILVVSPKATLIPIGACTWWPTLLASAPTFLVPTNGAGSATVPIPIPTGTSGIEVYAQWATLDPGGPSPVLGGTALSNAIEIHVN